MNDTIPGKLNLIYLAAPYTSDNPQTQIFRVQQAARAANVLLSKGFHVYAPTVHGHYIDSTPAFPAGVIPYKHWIDTGLDMLRRSDLMYVLDLRGWDKSTGVQGEIEYAESLDLPVLLLDHRTHKTKEMPHNEYRPV